MKYGKSIRWFNDYNKEIQFSITNKFDFMQIWFLKGELILDKVSKPKEQFVLNTKFPVIIHAVYDIDDYEKYNKELLRILKYFGHKEVIIHPICESIPIDNHTIYTLADNIIKQINY